MIDKEKISKHLQRKMDVFAYDITDSTNEQAHRYLKENACDRAVFVANCQTAGKGRLGRSFYSPADTGIYMTYVFSIGGICKEVLRITTAASVAVAMVLDCGAKIKWVNDLYLYEKKICGILTETVMTDKTYVLIGIGINLTTKEFPRELAEKAGAVGVPLDKEKTVAAICDRLSMVADDPYSAEYLSYYRENMLGIGKPVIYTADNQRHQAIIEGINEFGELTVSENGIQKILSSGEISLCFSKGERYE